MSERTYVRQGKSSTKNVRQEKCLTKMFDKENPWQNVRPEKCPRRPMLDKENVRQEKCSTKNVWQEKCSTKNVRQEKRSTKQMFEKKNVQKKSSTRKIRREIFRLLPHTLTSGRKSRWTNNFINKLGRFIIMKINFDCIFKEHASLLSTILLNCFQKGNSFNSFSKCLKFILK